MRTIGLQTYTIRKLYPYQFESTLQQLKEIGLTQLEVARIPLEQKTIDAIKKYDMDVISLQVTLNKMIKMREQIVHFCQSFTTPYIVISVLPIRARIPFYGMKWFTKTVKSLIEEYRSEGIQVALHHHLYEMSKEKNNLKLDRILQGFNHDLKLVLDTYWITRSQLNPSAIYQKYYQDVIGIHLRDCLTNKKNITPGQGIINFKELLSHLDSNVYTVIEINTKNPLSDLELGKKYMEEIHAS